MSFRIHYSIKRAPFFSEAIWWRDEVFAFLVGGGYPPVAILCLRCELRCGSEAWFTDTCPRCGWQFSCNPIPLPILEPE